MDKATTIWMDGEMVPWDDAQVHFLTHALHYGTAVFEGIRAYQTPDGTAIFRLREHIERLRRSAQAYAIPWNHDVEELMEACRQVMRANRLETGYIRPLVYYGVGAIGLNPAAAEVKTGIAAWEWGAYLGEEGIQNGIRVRISSWRRISGQSFVPIAKGSGQYLNSVLAKQEAVATGYDEALMLNVDGNVAEGSGENLFLIRDGIVYTPPVSTGILDGITRASVIALLEAEGVDVREAGLTRGDLYAADELFLTGTAAEVTPIREVDDRPIGTGKPGPLTRQAQSLYADAVTGKVEARSGWLDFI
ncbi:MAG TPA: branched-chain amino acid transaminase [Acidimicrobiia bacterium]|nr:branched-chain amino acid transaminase [Acidimicrobiia bacterium]